MVMRIYLISLILLSFYDFCVGQSILTDIDGNTYRTVEIGDKVWMAENLKTTKFNNGKDIPLITDNGKWLKAKRPAYSWYENDRDKYGETYGALYNWYTVNTGKLCPTGWHVSSRQEGFDLNRTLGQMWANSSDTIVKYNIKITPGWTDGLIIDNSNGFTALPAGRRSDVFWGIGKEASWWYYLSYDEKNNTYIPEKNCLRFGYSLSLFFRFNIGLRKFVKRCCRNFFSLQTWGWSDLDRTQTPYFRLADGYSWDCGGVSLTKIVGRPVRCVKNSSNLK